MISRTDTTLANLVTATAALKQAAGKPLSADGMRAANEFVRYTEEFRVDIPGSESFVLVSTGAGRVFLSVEQERYTASGDARDCHDINRLSDVDLAFVAWLRRGLSAWAQGKADLVGILERSKGWRVAADAPERASAA